MADTRISELTSLAQNDVDEATDVVAIVDSSATQTKNVTPEALIKGAGGMYADGSTPLSGTLRLDGNLLSGGFFDGTLTGSLLSEAGSAAHPSVMWIDKVGGTIKHGFYDYNQSLGYAWNSSIYLEFKTSHIAPAPGRTVDIGTPGDPFTEGYIDSIYISGATVSDGGSDISESGSITALRSGGGATNSAIYYGLSTGSHTGNLFRGIKRSDGAGDIFSGEILTGSGRGLQLTMETQSSNEAIFVAMGNGEVAMKMNDYTATITGLDANQVNAVFNDGSDKTFTVRATNEGAGDGIVAIEADSIILTGAATIDLSEGRLINGKPLYVSSSIETASTYTLTDTNHGQILFFSAAVLITVPNTLTNGVQITATNYMSGTQFRFTGSGGTDFIFPSQTFQTASASTPRGSSVVFTVGPATGEVLVSGDLEVL